MIRITLKAGAGTYTSRTLAIIVVGGVVGYQHDLGFVAASDVSTVSVLPMTAATPRTAPSGP